MPEQRINVATNMDEQLDINSYFPVFLTSLRNSIDLHTAVALPIISKGLGKTLLYCATSVGSVSGGRTMALDYYKIVFKDYFKDHPHVTRGLIMDNDIGIQNPLKVIDAIKYADENKINIVANYYHAGIQNNRLHITNTLYKSKDDTSTGYTMEELAALDNYAKVGCAGMGFYYGDINLDYEFHENRRGDDVNFYNENNLEIHYAKDIILKHFQSFYV